MNQQYTLRKSASIGLSAVVLSMFALSVQANLNLVKNGSFETVTTTKNDAFSLAGVSNWATLNSYTFLEVPGGATLPFAPSNGGSLYSGIACTAPILPTTGPAPSGCFPTTSPDGGNFVVADGGAYPFGVLWQSLTGLVVGQSYEVSFWQAAGQQKTYPGNTLEQWIVTLGGTLGSGNVNLTDGTTVNVASMLVGGKSQHSDLMSTPNKDFVDWQYQTMTFQATDPNLPTGATMPSTLLGFLSIGSPFGVPPFVLLDGVSVEAVPEPASYALLGIGLLGALFARRQKKCA
ncbi:MAG: PEP-CTERM sorting domain-containing protein [Methylophilaceae bacterium]|nr:PEP-CTERM sorting domain-containing protein [Methylophilaceae bacterium]